MHTLLDSTIYSLSLILISYRISFHKSVSYGHIPAATDNHNMPFFFMPLISPLMFYRFSQHIDFEMESPYD